MNIVWSHTQTHTYIHSYLIKMYSQMNSLRYRYFWWQPFRVDRVYPSWFSVSVLYIYIYMSHESCILFLFAFNHSTSTVCKCICCTDKLNGEFSEEYTYKLKYTYHVHMALGNIYCSVQKKAKLQYFYGRDRVIHLLTFAKFYSFLFLFRLKIGQFN